LANAFARRGIAALIYDKRGVGTSTGQWRDAAFAELVGDASAAVEALRSRPQISPDRVGIHGHSQGGTIAPWVANENPHVSSSQSRRGPKKAILAVAASILTAASSPGRGARPAACLLGEPSAVCRI
jgi:alpha-beta hydrolase superfamily lysophospholipase